MRTAVLVLAVLSSVVVSAKELGDARPIDVIFIGGSHGAKTSPTLEALRARLATLEPKDTFVVFTGNYTADGFPNDDDPHRAEAERAVMLHVDATRDFVARGGRVFYLPGHVDFPDGHTSRVRRLRKFLNHAYGEHAEDEKFDVMPLKACGDHELLELSPAVGLLLVNSQWWMQRDVGDDDANEGCESVSRDQFNNRLNTDLADYRTRRLLVAAHHPLASLGPFGGRFTARAHLPPVVGTASVVVRSVGLVEQYASAPLVRTWADGTRDMARRLGSYVFVSGHDQSLQFLHYADQTQIISGTSSTEATPTAGAEQGAFALAQPGWVEVQLDETGLGEAVFKSGESSPFHGALPPLGTAGAPMEQPPAPMPESPVVSTYTGRGEVQFPRFVRLLTGTFYTSAYALEMDYPVLDLAQAHGGLEVDRLGGGWQSNSMHLRDPNGGDWALRGLNKVADRVLPWPLGRSQFLVRALEQGMTAVHPEAALAVPRLAEAAGVLHQEPKLYFLPDQEALGAYRSLFRDRVVMLEQRPKMPDEGELPETLVGPPSEGGKTKLRSTDDLVEKTQEEPWQHAVDQEAFLRARLLDLFLGDWDRHEDQWRWAGIKSADEKRRYLPIARDRDQAMANYDGLGLAIARMLAPGVRVMQPFDGVQHSLEWTAYSGRHLDHAFLNQISRERWLAIAAEVQAALSDAVLDEAFATWHRESFELDGRKLRQVLAERRDHMLETAADYFHLINRNVEVVGSTHDDRFELTMLAHGSMHLTVRRAETDEIYFDRVIEDADTQELRIYALDGDDQLTVNGEGPTHITVRFVGGRGDDRVSASAAPTQAEFITLYDVPDGATIDPSIEVTDERSHRSALNHYDRRENHEPDALTVAPSIRVNPDVGSFYGLQFLYTVQGYKRAPYAAQHAFSAALYTSTVGVALDYNGHFLHSLGLFDQHLDVAIRTPTDTRNFFGLTNEYVKSDWNSRFYRLLQTRYEGRYGISYDFQGTQSRVGAEVFGLALNTENTPDRFVAQATEVHPNAMGSRFFGGARLYATTSTFNDPIRPTQGVALTASIEGRDEAQGGQFSVTFRGTAAVAIPIDRERRVVLLSRVVGEGIAGAHPFYFAPTLGAPLLRAYRYNQFAGDFALAHSSDLRFDVLRFVSGIPGSVGIDLSADHGRVFDTTHPSTLWHLSLGGGLWWFIFDRVGVALSYHRSLEGADRLSFTFGTLFSPTGS